MDKSKLTKIQSDYKQIPLYSKVDETYLSMTLKQKFILDVIESEIIKNQRMPTIRDVAEIIGVTEKAIFDQVQALKKKGMVRNDNFHAGVYSNQIRFVKIVTI